MKTLKWYEALGFSVILGLTVMAGISCGTTQASTAPELSGVTWMLVSYGDSDNLTAAVEDKHTTLVFDDKEMTVSGTGGVNSYGGDYAIDGDKITFTKVFRTLMAGFGPIQAQEDVFFRILEAADAYSLDGNQLTITGTEGVLVFTRA